MKSATVTSLITPAQIREKAERKYLAFLKSILAETSIFPLDISFRKVKASDDYLSIKTGLEALLKGAKVTQGYGYQVALQPHTMRRYGRQSLPVAIFFETETDYLKFIQKQKEVTAFRQAVRDTREVVPELLDWLSQYPQRLVDHLAAWSDLLQVCRYFQQNPCPRLYIRELPINVHTKFIEAHKTILRPLLEALLPPDAIRDDESRFEARFHLRYDEPLMRLRVLDAALQTHYHWPVADFSSPLSEFVRLDLYGHRVVITENKLNFLTLPPISNGLALFGSGFKMELLQAATWLAACDLYYWGDLDAQGFQILSQLRACFPQTRSLMMDQATLDAFEGFTVPGTPTEVKYLPHLTPDELALFTHLATNNLRLEQERVRQAYVVEQLQLASLIT